MDEIRFQPEPMNQVLLRGVSAESAENISHENHGKRFDRLTLSVQRLSGTYDHLEILADQTLTQGICLLDGPMLEVRGEIRSFNNHSGPGRRLVITVYARSITPWNGAPENSVRSPARCAGSRCIAIRRWAGRSPI